ncbi:MAG: hypothetical protein WB562_09430, partial [Candidatus Sulfotelmatobacter sp.]
MSGISPTLAGFRAAFRRPSLTFAEMAWRWSVGAASAGLMAFAFFEYLDSLPLTGTEAFLLRSKQPLLIARVIAHILRGSLQQAAFAVLIGILGLTVLWIVAASLGRVATVHSLLEYFRKDFSRSVFLPSGGDRTSRDVASNVSTDISGAPHDGELQKRPGTAMRQLFSLFGLHFLRFTVALAALAAFQGAAILAGFASPEADPQPGLSFLLFLPLAGLICLAWWALNWFLSLAAVFAVRAGEDALGALSAAVALCRERAGPVFAVSIWTGLAHLSVLFGATTVVSIPLSLASVAPMRLVIAVVIVVTLAYFAVADWLYMARLAGYVCIAEMPDDLPVPLRLPSVTPSSGDV